MDELINLLESRNSDDWSRTEPYLRGLTPIYIWMSPVPLWYIKRYINKVASLKHTFVSDVPADSVVKYLLENEYIFEEDNQGLYGINYKGERAMEEAIFAINKDDDRHTRFVLDSLRFLGRLSNSLNLMVVPGFKMRNIAIKDESGKVLLMPDLLLYLDDSVVRPRAFGFESYVACECQREDVWKLRDKLKTQISSIRNSDPHTFPLCIVRDDDTEKFGDSGVLVHGKYTDKQFEEDYRRKQSKFISEKVSPQLDKVVPWRKQTEQEEEMFSGSIGDQNIFSRPLSDYFYNVLYLSSYGIANTWKIPLDRIITISDDEAKDAAIMSDSMRKIIEKARWY